MLSIKIGLTLPLMGETTIYERVQSIVQSVEFLWENNNRFVAFLILFFSIIVPFAKATMLLIALMFKKLKKRYELFRFVHAIGKWSMADVFVVGVFIAFLSTKSTEGIQAELYEGFYYFTGYCILSLLSAQLIQMERA